MQLRIYQLQAAHHQDSLHEGAEGQGPGEHLNLLARGLPSLDERQDLRVVGSGILGDYFLELLVPCHVLLRINNFKLSSILAARWLLLVQLRDEKPYITNGVTNPWVSDWLEVPDAEAFDPEQHCPAGPINDDNRRNPDGFATPGTPRSDITLANSPDFIVIYDTQEHPLLVSVKNPEQVAILPQATDYFIERNHMNLRWFVSSPSLGLMVYATRLEP